MRRLPPRQEFCQTEIIFPPGKDTNPTEIVDPFPCLWTDPFCIIYLHAGIVLHAYDIPDVNFLSEDDFCDDDDLWDQKKIPNLRQFFEFQNAMAFSRKILLKVNLFVT